MSPNTEMEIATSLGPSKGPGATTIASECENEQSEVDEEESSSESDR
jgi:hypothetical protein